jgi:DNA-directed RNA polymerase specialized sigma subunit
MRVADPPRTTSRGTRWGEQTRGVLTRDLLVRASHVPHGEGRALQFRVLHMNLALVVEVAGRLGLTGTLPADVEQAALEGLLDAVRGYDPHGEAEFAACAETFIADRIRAQLPARPVGVRTPRPTRR